VLILVLRIIRRAVVILAILALLFSIGLETIPVFTDGSNEVVNAVRLTNQQYGLAERIAKDALVLTQTGDHSQAILELQVTLPVFEKTQLGLQKYDPSLEIPAHIPGDVEILIVQSQPDYTAMDSAARSILKNADPPINLNELAIVQEHERPYFLEMNSISKIWQGHIEDTAHNFFSFELGFGVGALVLLIVHWILGLFTKEKKGHAATVSKAY
jgi:hypothetical protein